MYSPIINAWPWASVGISQSRTSGGGSCWFCCCWGDIPSSTTRPSTTGSAEDLLRNNKVPKIIISPIPALANNGKLLLKSAIAVSTKLELSGAALTTILYSCSLKPPSESRILTLIVCSPGAKLLAKLKFEPVPISSSAVHSPSQSAYHTTDGVPPSISVTSTPKSIVSPSSNSRGISSTSISGALFWTLIVCVNWTCCLPPSPSSATTRNS